MKKLILLLLAIPWLCYGAADDVKTINGKAVTAVVSTMGATGTGIATMLGKNYTDGDVAGCTTANDTLLSSDALTWGNADNVTTAISNTSTYKATKFSVAAQSTITEYVVRVMKAGAADDFVFFAEIWTHDAGEDEPDAVVADTRVTLASADITEDVFESEIMTLAVPKAAMGAATYWLVMGLSARTSGQAAVSLDNNDMAGGRWSTSADTGATWTETANQAYRIQVYGCAD